LNLNTLREFDPNPGSKPHKQDAANFASIEASQLHQDDQLEGGPASGVTLELLRDGI